MYQKLSKTDLHFHKYCITFLRLKTTMRFFIDIVSLGCLRHSWQYFTSAKFVWQVYFVICGERWYIRISSPQSPPQWQNTVVYVKAAFTEREVYLHPVCYPQCYSLSVSWLSFEIAVNRGCHCSVLDRPQFSQNGTPVEVGELHLPSPAHSSQTVPFMLHQYRTVS